MTGETLTKLILNNTIVKMRKNIRQARVQCINKLSKEIRKLRDKKGTEEQVAKNLRKVDKLIEQLSFIKKVNPDTVSKFALQTEKAFIDITNDVHETTENKALSRFAYHKSVHQKVVEFREKFPDWKKTLPTFLESLGEKYKNKKRNKLDISGIKEKNFKSFKNNPNSTTSKIGKEKLKISKISHDTTVKSSSGFWTVQDSINDDGDNESSFSYNVSKNTSDSHKSSKEVSSIDEERILSYCKPVNSFESKIKKFGNPDRNLKTKFNSSLQKNIETQENPKKDVETDVSQIAADPFFVTTDNKEYLSISARQISAEEESPVTHKVTNEINRQSKSERFNTKQIQHKQKSSRSNITPSKSNFPKRLSLDSVYKKPEKPKGITATASLHPSWEAKRKLNATIPSNKFLGKKIRFDD